jgi:hypothetical protein
LPTYLETSKASKIWQKFAANIGKAKAVSIPSLCVFDFPPPKLLLDKLLDEHSSSEYSERTYNEIKWKNT